MKFTWIAGLAALALPGVAQAHGAFRFSLGLGVAPGYCYPTFGFGGYSGGPRYYAAPAVTYYTPPPVLRYAPPPAVYVAPESVYASPPVVYPSTFVAAAPPLAYVPPPVVYASPGAYYSTGYYGRRAPARYYRSNARYVYGR